MIRVTAPCIYTFSHFFEDLQAWEIGRMSRFGVGAILFLIAAWSWASPAEFKGENLLQSTPRDYKLAASGRNGSVLTDKMIPESEHIDRWTEMLTTQIYIGGIDVSDPKTFYQRVNAAWGKACPSASGELIQTGTENGYPFAVWMQACAENPASRKPEYTWFKAIQGNDSFYLIQKSWRYTPSPEQIKRWTRYLGSIAVCDARLPAQSCAALLR